MGIVLPYDELSEIRKRMRDISPNLVAYGEVEGANYYAQATELSKLVKKSLGKEALDVPIKELEDYYMTDVISRASSTMAKCIVAVKKQKESKY